MKILPQIKQIAARVRELREILGIPADTVAAHIGVTTDEYKAYEEASDDIPVGKLYLIASELGVDPTELLAGDAPKMVDYTVVRNGHGLDVDRYAGYRFSSLASNFVGREMEPMIVTLEPDDAAPEKVVHEGQEFNFVLQGKVCVAVGAREFLLEEGDSIYFNPSLPHSQRAVGIRSRFLTVINERMHKN